MIYPQKGTSIGHFGAKAAEVNDTADVSRALKITSASAEVIQVLEFYDLRKNVDVLKFIFFDRIMKIPLNFSNFSFGDW
jgi:hypothetical protein